MKKRKMSIEEFAEKRTILIMDKDDLEQRFLASHGWRYSSDHPDFCWRWEKTINGKTYALPKSEAVEFEERLHE